MLNIQVARMTHANPYGDRELDESERFVDGLPSMLQFGLTADPDN